MSGDARAELLISGGPIWCGKREGFAEAVAVGGGRIVAAGTITEVEGAIGAPTLRLDLTGRLAVPGFIEAYMQLMPYGLGFALVNLRPDDGVCTLNELLHRAAAAAARKPSATRIFGCGYDQRALDIGHYPKAQELDRVAPHHSVVLKRTSGHVFLANSTALHAAGMTTSTLVPNGRAIGREEGRRTRAFRDRTMRQVQHRVPPPDEAAMVDAIGAACRTLAAFGFTAATDMNVGATAGLAEIDAYRCAERKVGLPLCFWQVLAGNPEGIADAVWDAGLRPMSDEPLLRWGAMKVFADGSGRPAAFSDLYIEARGAADGLLCFPADTRNALFAHDNRRGGQRVIHAIGDAEIEQLLSGMEASDTPDYPVVGRRHRMEPCGFVTAGKRQRRRGRDIISISQPVFIHEFGDLSVSNLRRARVETSDLTRTTIDQGADPSASSDGPVSFVDSFVNLHATLTRQTHDSTVLGPDQRITLAEALHAHTGASAYTEVAQAECGTRAFGMRADCAVIVRDQFPCDPAEIFAAKVDVTLRDGAVLFDWHDRLAAAAAA